MYCAFLLAICFCHGVFSAAPPLGAYNIKPGSLTVSGTSGGAAFATQFHVGYSALVKGMASFAGVPYYCAKGSILEATLVCNPNNGIDIDSLISQATDYAANGDVDPTFNMRGSKVFLFHGTLDSTVDPGNAGNMQTFYNAFEADVMTMVTMEAGHGVPTEDYGVLCSSTETPFLNNCSYNGAFEALNHLYGGTLNSPVTSTGQLLQYDQDEFNQEIIGNSWYSDGGFLYVPEACANNDIQCLLHVAFHGCDMTRDDIDDIYPMYAGYREVADANNMIVLFPQVRKQLEVNINGCFDWWGYDGINYATQDGDQMKAVKLMVDRVMSGTMP